LFKGQQFAKRVLIVHQRFIKIAAELAALIGGFRAPCRKGFTCRGDRCARFISAEIGNRANGFAGRGVGDGNGPVPAAPLAANITSLTEKTASGHGRFLQSNRGSRLTTVSAFCNRVELAA